MSMSINSCKECKPPKRYPGCHDHCQEYLAQKAEHDKCKAEEYKKRQTSYGITIERTAAVAKAMKGRRICYKSINSKRGRE